MLANPMNKDLDDNLIPIWTGRELDKLEIIEMPDETRTKSLQTSNTVKFFEHKFLGTNYLISNLL